MSPTYGTAECAVCYIRLTKPEMVKFDEISVEPSQTRTYFKGDGLRFPQQTGHSVSDGRKRLRTVWVCHACERIYRKRRVFTTLFGGFFGPLAANLVGVSLERSGAERRLSDERDVESGSTEPPAAQREPPVASRKLALHGPGEQIVFGITTVLGRAQFRKWGNDFERFMSVSQFRVIRSPAGAWTIEHCPEAVNETNLDGVALAGPVALRSGVTISLGRACRCPIRVSFID